MEVREICSSPLQTVGSHETLATAADTMRTADVSALFVTTNGDVVGIVTERDLVQAIADKAALGRTPVSAYMTVDMFGASGELDASEAARMMLDNGVRHLPVLEGEEVVGMLSTRDLLVLESWPAA